MGRLKVSVSYYDDFHKKEFSTYPNSGNIKKVVEGPTSIQKEEFLTYLLFVEQKNVAGFKYYNELKNKIPSRINFFEDYIKFTKESVTATFIGKDNKITERIGVAISLCLMNLLHNLHEADWEFIPEKPGRGGHPTFDFIISSDGKKFIQVESKGSTVEDNTKKTGLGGHIKSIDRKKKYLKEEEKKRKIPKHKNLAYGVIGVLDNRPNSIAKSWMLDPPAFQLQINPRKYKLISRLIFYWENLRGISSRSTILTALINRITTLQTIEDYQVLDRQSLLNSNGETIQILAGSFYTKSVIKGTNITIETGNSDNTIGKLYQMPEKNKLFYIGFLRDVFEMLIEQDFNRILNFKKPNKIVNERILCRVSEKQNERLQIPDRYLSERRNDGYYEFQENGIMVYSQSGRVFGIIDLQK